ncbi:AAA family ATPase [Thermococcus sp.]
MWKGEKFTAILGPRRVGKTSVLRTFLNHYSYPCLYYDLSPYIGLTGVSSQVLIPVLIGFETSKLSRKTQLSLGILKLNFNFKVERGIEFENAMINLLREVNEKYERFLLIFDEAQMLAFVRGVNMMGLLQMIHNTLDNVVVIIDRIDAEAS